MPIVKVKTNLKSLQYGNDRIGGGSSNQPYIQTPIPDRIGGSGFLDALNEDFILRGGTRAVTDSVIDIKRLSNFFLDRKDPSGLLFTAKQNLLSRTAVRTQASRGVFLNDGIYTPLSTLAQAGGEAFGLHVNKQGLNPLKGLFSNYSPDKYFDTIREEFVGVTGNEDGNTLVSNNRLINLYQGIILADKRINLGNRIIINGGLSQLFGKGTNVLSYPGGPGAPLGIGRTYIKFATDNYGAPLRTRTGKGFLKVGSSDVFTNDQIGEITDTPQDGESFIIGAPNSEYGGEVNRYGYNNTVYVGDFRKSNSDVFAPDYYTKNIEFRLNLGNPGANQGVRNINNYQTGINGEGNAFNSSFDRLNTLPIYQSKNQQPALNGKKPVNDLVKFRIGVYDLRSTENIEKNYIHFRAFLDQISDNYTADWSPTKYIGRGENFYTYNGFDRKVSLSWTVAAQSKIELIPMYQKLNYLASICAPDYSSKGYMRGNIVTLTIGGYFYEQPGIITGLNYEMNDESATWEIGINTEGGDDTSVKELPHLIKVSGFNFIPIHNFVPRLQQLTFDDDGNLNKFGDERYIALNSGDNNNWGKIISPGLL